MLVAGGGLLPSCRRWRLLQYCQHWLEGCFLGARGLQERSSARLVIR